MASFDVYRPDYTIKKYRDDFFKVVRFNRSDNVSFALTDKKPKENDSKLSASLSRARGVITQLALCNDWEWFFTGTLNGDLHNRDDLFHFRNTLTQWIRDLNKQPGYNVSYVLVPERHKDGSWHMHGLLKGLPADALSPFIRGVHPWKLVNSDYVNWPGYSKKFGFCSLGKVKDPVAVGFYLQKYITKSMDNSVDGVGDHTYFCSRGLSRASVFGDVYGREYDLDQLLTHDYDFCSTGYVTAEWHFFLPYIEPDGGWPVDGVFGSVQLAKPVEQPDSCSEWEQMIMFGFSKLRDGVIG